MNVVAEDIAAEAVAPPVRPSRGVWRRLRSRFSLRRFLASAGVRFGLIYAGLFGVSAFALAAFVWWSTAGLVARQTDTAINADAQGLFERYGQGGSPALIETIQERLVGNVDDDAIYLLVDPNFARIAGNLERWPFGVTAEVGWFELPVERAGVSSLARIRNVNLPNGDHLLVGRNVQVRTQLRRLLTDSLLWSIGIVVVLGVIGALAVRGLFRMTIGDVSAVANAVSAGDLTRRVRVAGYGDEFDTLAESINDMLDRITSLMDGVRQVSNSIAHDLRTPIARARARLEDAAIHAKTDVELRAAVERATVDLDGIVAVFQALLRIAEIEAGSRRSAFARMDLAPMLEDMAELYGAVAEERGMELSPSIPAALPAYGDRDMVQQAVANLLDNALKFSPLGGRIVLGAAAHGDTVEIVVADQGPGIPAADRERATERFFRGEEARSTPGSGLGLALVAAVATLHGGVLRLEDARPGLRAVLMLSASDRGLPDRPG